MNIATTVEQAKQTVRQWKAEGLTVGLVPTMGYLHEGHESLIKRAVAECDRVMVSVFLNPIQFAPNEDLATYPRDFAADTVLIENAGRPGLPSSHSRALPRCVHVCERRGNHLRTLRQDAPHAFPRVCHQMISSS